MSMDLIRPFGPRQSTNTVNLAVTASSQTLAVPVAGIGYRSVRICNVGSNVVFLQFGTSTATATTTTSMPMAGDSVEVFLLDPETTYVAAIAGTTGNTIYMTVGTGV